MYASTACSWAGLLGQLPDRGLHTLEHRDEVLGVRRLVRCALAHDHVPLVVDGDVAVVRLGELAATLHDAAVGIREVALGADLGEAIAGHLRMVDGQLAGLHLVRSAGRCRAGGARPRVLRGLGARS
jgi:hypothetical protein